MDAPKWYDQHISRGNIINMMIVVFLAGGAWFAMDQRMGTFDHQLTRHDGRLDQIEKLQISMAEVVLQQSQFQGQISRLEARMDEKYRELSRRMELMENRVYRGSNPRPEP